MAEPVHTASGKPWCEVEEKYRYELLKQAIDESKCMYCGADYGEPCVTMKGRAPGTAWPGLLHIGRVHKGHCLLVEVGDPGRVSGLLCPDGETGRRSVKEKGAT